MVEDSLREPGPSASIRPLVEADLPLLHRWYQTPELSRHLVEDIPPRSDVEAIGFMRGWLAPDPANLRFAVVRTADGALLGRTALLQIADGAAELHLFLGDPDTRGKGYGTASVGALLRTAFDDRCLELVRLDVLTSNAPAIALYRRFGFQETGRRIDGASKNGHLVDVLQMALTRHAHLTADRP
jgi:RimJ/RimL family protein N-acetyltransferase